MSINPRDNKVVIHDGHVTHPFLGFIQFPRIFVGSKVPPMSVEYSSTYPFRGFPSIWKLDVVSSSSLLMASWVPNSVRMFEKVMSNYIVPSTMTCADIVVIYVAFLIIDVHLNSQDKQRIVFLITHRFSTFVNVLMLAEVENGQMGDISKHESTLKLVVAQEWLFLVMRTPIFLQSGLCLTCLDCNKRRFSHSASQIDKITSIVHKTHPKYTGYDEMEWLIAWFWNIVEVVVSVEQNQHCFVHWQKQIALGAILVHGIKVVEACLVYNLETRLISKSEVMIRS